MVAFRSHLYMDILHAQLSYQLVGLAYRIQNVLGCGHNEKVYQNAYEQELIANKIPYQREVYTTLQYRGANVGKSFLDFLVNNVVIIELKVGPEIINPHLRQVLEYLRVTDKELAIIICFTKTGVRYKRIISPDYRLAHK